MTFRLGFVTGATPDKWAGVWRQRSREPIDVVPVEEDTQLHGVRAGALDVALVRLPVDREGIHLIPLYEERPVVVVSVESTITVVDEVSLEDLADEQLLLPHASGWTPSVAQQDWPPMSLREAVEVAASGTGIVVAPLSVARLHHRRDVTYRPVTDLPATTVGLAWLEGNDDPRIQTFIGIVRGRSERSSRG